MFDEVSPTLLAGTISIGIIVPSILVYLYRTPEHFIRLAARYEMYKSGMKQKYVKHGKDVYSYGEKNSPKPDQPTLVFLHGFTSSKLQWLPVFKLLRSDSHMIAMDMPGHGNSSTPDKNDKIDLDFMDSKLCAFIESVGLADKKVHVVGVSLGGALAGIFAALHPDKVAKVTMLCPAMNPPIESDFVVSLKKSMHKELSEITYDDCVFFPHDIAGMKEMFDLCLYRKDLTNLHPKVFEGMLNIRQDYYPYLLRLYKATNTHEYLDMLADLAASIKMPSQIMWGRNDEIIDCSGADHLKQRLPDCRKVDIFECCGHAIDIDRPGSLCKALGNFIKEK